MNKMYTFEISAKATCFESLRDEVEYALSIIQARVESERLDFPDTVEEIYSELLEISYRTPGARAVSIDIDDE